MRVAWETWAVSTYLARAWQVVVAGGRGHSELHTGSEHCFLNATLPPIGAIIIFDYFGHPQQYETGAEANPGVHWGAVAGVVAGALTGNFLHAGIASINAMIVGCFCYLVYDQAVGR